MEEGRRILVVDGECDLRVYLEMHDYIVLQAAGCKEALARVRSALPDLVVLVVMTPGMDGIDILRALRLGADDYVTKPCSQRGLLARIESVLRRAARGARGRRRPHDRFRAQPGQLARQGGVPDRHRAPRAL